MTNEIIEKLKKEQELSIEEIALVLPEIISKVRKKLKEVPITDEKKCVESNKFMQRICDKLNIYYFPLDTRNLKNESLFHKFGLIIFNPDTKPISFITDLTYNQFKVEPEYKKISPSMFLESNSLNKLIKDGYLPFTKKIFENYIMSFISANTKKTGKGFFDSIKSELGEFNIKFNLEKDYEIGNINLQNKR